MKSRPIQFDKDMIINLLDGCKNQVRFPVDIPESHEDLFGIGADSETVDMECPYGQVGDELWVRERWGYHGGSSGGMEDRHCIHVKYLADKDKEYHEIHFKNYKKMSDAMPSQTGYKRPENHEWMEDWEEDEHRSDFISKWWEDQKDKPADTMQKWASRIILEITDIRTERLQDIDGPANGEWWRDCLNEGVYGKREAVYSGSGLMIKVLWKFRDVWNETHIEKGIRWRDNPLVWVISFKVKQIKDNKRKRSNTTRAVAGKRRPRRR